VVIRPRKMVPREPPDISNEKGVNSGTVGGIREANCVVGENEGTDCTWLGGWRRGP